MYCSDLLISGSDNKNQPFDRFMTHRGHFSRHRQNMLIGEGRDSMSHTSDSDSNNDSLNRATRSVCAAGSPAGCKRRHCGSMTAISSGLEISCMMLAESQNKKRKNTGNHNQATHSYRGVTQRPLAPACRIRKSGDQFYARDAGTRRWKDGIMDQEQLRHAVSLLMAMVRPGVVCIVSHPS